ncbi:MAG: tripartite tricarboxylate transporter substrate binding protein [Gammaproteobacteria bacterium]|nr:tripartite tricarboxylate transporter substrate binding protein [Gammaproteobacteria bacterium]
MKIVAHFSKAAAALVLAVMMVGNAAAWEPDGPLKLQIGFGAGGETDTIGRVIARALEEQTGWQVIAENKPGGGGLAMFTGIAAMPPDGTVIGMGVNMPVMINLLLRGETLPFDLDSFDYLATVGRAPLVIIARSDAPYDDVNGLAAWSRENDGVAVAFDAKPQELMLQRIDKQENAGFKLVSTKSAAEMIQYLLGEQVAASFSAGTHISYMESGDVKMLASANSARHDYAPEVRTLREQGYDLFSDPWFYIAAPAGLPGEAKAALAGALDEALKTDAVKKIVANTLSSRPVNLGPEGTRQMFTEGMDGVKVLFGD